VLRWRRCEPQSLDIDALPPIELMHFALVHAPRDQSIAYAERTHE
jgi:hypothetical protein